MSTCPLSRRQKNTHQAFPIIFLEAVCDLLHRRLPDDANEKKKKSARVRGGVVHGCRARGVWKKGCTHNLACGRHLTIDLACVGRGGGRRGTNLSTCNNAELLGSRTTCCDVAVGGALEKQIGQVFQQNLPHTHPNHHRPPQHSKPDQRTMTPLCTLSLPPRMRATADLSVPTPWNASLSCLQPRTHPSLHAQTHKRAYTASPWKCNRRVSNGRPNGEEVLSTKKIITESVVVGEKGGNRGDAVCQMVSSAQGKQGG